MVLTSYLIPVVPEVLKWVWMTAGPFIGLRGSRGAPIGIPETPVDSPMISEQVMTSVVVGEEAT